MYDFPTKAYTVDSIWAHRCQSCLALGNQGAGDGKAGHKVVEVPRRDKMVQKRGGGGGG